MASTRKRRLVKWAILALAGVVSLPMAYVGSYLGMHWLHGMDVISIDTVIDSHWGVYRPVLAYKETRLPGNEHLNQLAKACYQIGFTSSRQEARAIQIRKSKSEIAPTE